MVRFSEIESVRPALDAVTSQHDQFVADWQKAKDAPSQLAVIRRWDSLVRELATWENLTDLRFNQDTASEAYRSERDFCDEIRPKLTDLDVRMKRLILDSPFREEVTAELGTQALALWEADIASFDPAVETELVRESKLEAEYTELLAAAELNFRGQKLNLSGIAKYHTDQDRATRREANEVRWGWFESQAQALDQNFSELVAVRTQIARKLGFNSFVELGYQRMKRVDYGQSDVERFRKAVVEQVVPLTSRLRELQAEKLSIERVLYWDEGVFDPSGNPAPLGDHDWMIDRAKEMFDTTGPELGEFFRLMVDAELMDLKNRERKAGGGFCTDFPSHGLPYIFANFNGTKGDVEVFTHEIGHAFQCYSSRHVPLHDYLFPTCEACEIHSMGLEFLTWPSMERFFGDDAERFRQVHLMESLLFLPYGVAIDHFQHLVYESPTATAEERHQMWLQMEQLYMPWRDTTGLPHLVRGGQWQYQRHIYLCPFYYIDYTLALACALQFWSRSRKDYPQTMRDYVALCQRGGEIPFQELVASAGLQSPFKEDCLSEVVAQASQYLDG